jgi:hypothetical protein
MLFVAIVHMVRLGRQPIWTDEAHTMYFYVGRDWSWMWRVFLAYPTELPLYGLLVRLWSVLGTSVVWVRMLSVLFSVLAVPAVLSLADIVGVSRKGKILLAILLTSSAYLGFYGQEARCYSLLILLGALSMRDFLAVVLGVGQGRVVWARFTMVNAALLYTHYFSILIFAAYNAVVLLFFIRRVSLWRWFLSQGISGLLFLPWLPCMLRLVESAPILDMLRELKYKWPVVSLFGPVPLFLVGKSIFPSAAGPDYYLELGGLAAGCVAVAGLCAIGFCTLWRRRGWRVACVIGVLLFLPVVLAFVSTQLGVGAYNYSRVKYFSSLVPLAFVLAVFWEDDGRRRGLRVAAYFGFIVLLLVNLAGVLNYHFNERYLKDARMADCAGVMAGRQRTEQAMWILAASLREVAADWRPVLYVCGGRFVEPGGRPFAVRQGEWWDTIWPGGAGVSFGLDEFPDQLWLVARIEWRERAVPRQKQAKAALAFWDSWRQRGYQLGEMREFVGVQFCLAARVAPQEKQ